MPFSIDLGTSDHVLSAFFTLTTVSITCGFSVSGVIATVLTSDSKVSFLFVTGLSNSLLCLTVTFPVGSKPLPSATSVEEKVTFPALSACFVTVLPPIVKVTCAFGRAFVTVIPLFDKPPVFLSWSSAICGGFGLTLIATGTSFKIR